MVQNPKQQNRDMDMLDSKKRRRGVKEVGQSSEILALGSANILGSNDVGVDHFLSVGPGS